MHTRASMCLGRRRMIRRGHFGGKGTHGKYYLGVGLNGKDNLENKDA